MKYQGRGVIRLNDRTDHSGQVISASSGTIVLGRQVAIQGETTYCPACKGTFAIRPDGAGAKHEGNPTRSKALSRNAVRSSSAQWHEVIVFSN